MMMKSITLALSLVGAAAFSRSPMRMAAETSMVKNGWKYDQNKFVGGLPGSIAPLGEFDPLEICYPEEMSESDVKRLREAEVMHGRVAMMAFVGYIMGEAVTPLTGKSFIMPTVVSGPANSHLAQIIGEQPIAFFAFVCAIGLAEIRRAQIGWVSPDEALFTLRDDYYPGDIGFDPLGIRPDTPEAFATEQCRELSNGRLAMIAVAGLCAQEIVRPVQILENLGIQREIIA